ncbi:MAG: helix-turn-helix domain-containing protein [Gammaproteobacteria bacterium]|nr:helix-turn-helix domain-containing protein [Gammaproteobacteria bacterium]MBU1489883.1 helix-turn-helix domain-containing protein [Gammaproteobacteria bacterium]MBU2064818.1 helix-turn-helix domain-containing protein [Gammaproteobacteria bacterium]MBU2218729.1 helix-turn-helix domain-containing protein [Gammaproteobacteria bacterium]MBU2323333.1 helix-turn-helix domain-containing protein [Gammaproteobacteria bacterium]
MSDTESAAQVGILLYPGVQRAAVYGLSDIFTVANQLRREHAATHLPEIQVNHWQLDAQGLVTCADAPTGTHCPAIVIVPPCLGDHLDALTARPFIPAITSWHSSGTLISSVCAGVYLLAEAGLLNGRSATTHWSLTSDLANHYPAIAVDADKMIIDHGDVITAGGLMAWTDLGLTLVERLLGPSLAAETARFLVLDQPRHSQQCFKRFVPNLAHGDEVIVKAQHWLHAHDGQIGGINQLAAYTNLGERTLLRRFRHATGLTPTEYCQALRIGKACELLELTNRSIEHVAWTVGYRDTGAFRRLFNKATGLAPAHYRRRFGVGHKT